MDFVTIKIKKDINIILDEKSEDSGVNKQRIVDDILREEFKDELKNKEEAFGKAFFKTHEKKFTQVKKETSRINKKLYNNSIWLLTKLLPVKENRMLYVYSAEQVIDIYEGRYLKDKDPRKAIEAAKNVIKHPSKENKDIAFDLYKKAFYSAIRALNHENNKAANAANAAANAAGNASSGEILPFYFPDKANQVKTINYGISLLKKLDV